jgi:hypothetical protein
LSKQLDRVIKDLIKDLLKANILLWPMAFPQVMKKQEFLVAFALIIIKNNNRQLLVKYKTIFNLTSQAVIYNNIISS